MAATLDKDSLVKHSFWILTGLFLVLVLGCLAVLATSVSDTVNKEAETLKKAEATVQGIKDPKNERFVEAFKKQDELVEHKKDDVWKRAWETQKDMMTWPRALASRFQKYQYFGDHINEYDRAEFKQQYRDQYPELLEVVDPVGDNGEGAVQCKGGDWAAVLNLDQNFQDPPSDADIWLAQEELWVKREMLRIIHDANEYVARFKEVAPEDQQGKENKGVKAGPAAAKEAKSAKPDAAAAAKAQKPPQPAPLAARSDPNHKIFRNPFWEFDLTLAELSPRKYVLRGKITNISKRKRSLDTKFKVFLQDPRQLADPSFQPLSVAGLPLAVGESKEVSQPVDPQRAIEGLFGIEQILNWRTAAVKRLDELQLMYPSSRTASRTLKPPLPNAPAFKPNTPEGGDSSADANAQSAGAPVAGSASYSPSGAAQAPGTTLSGLRLDRYTDVSAAVRHMPVAMVMVVDEEHLPELLAAFVNSKLRIQVTQYHWHHCRDHMNPQLNEEGPQSTPSTPSFMGRERTVVGPSAGGPGMMIGGRRVAYGVRADYPGGGRVPGVRPGSPTAYNMPRRIPGGPGPGPIRPGPQMAMPSAGRMPVIGAPYGSSGVSEDDQEQEDLNLVEVAVYGLASLYERYPPKPADQGASDEKKPDAGATGGQ
jgi:hypothetical protein